MNVRFRWNVPFGYRIYGSISTWLKVYKKQDAVHRLRENYTAMSRDDQDVLIAALTGVSVRRLIYNRSGP